MTIFLLRLVGPLHIAGGLILAASAFFPGLQQLIATIFLDATLVPWSAFFVAVLGPTIASWGLLFSAVLAEYLRSPSRRLWNALMGSVLVWATFDTALCLYFEVINGALLNSFVVTILVSLLFGVKYRRTESERELH